ncbi:MAG: acetyl-CoA carboxylase biotin carboxylase subunit [Thermodesulfobacteriota bacterium]|nr:acetyl-CoA carboxylase biotin carboxylase subunit [Thermodesulfobacteriota bacterium]
MFNKILIANRGEIAIRIIRTCRDIGVKSIAIYSEADRTALHVRRADEAYCVGPPPSIESYLNPEAILAAAKKSGAEAVHPGYGFLSENADFARQCAQAGLTFIGPEPEVIEKMSDKTVARRIMIKNGIPVIPGAAGEAGSLEDAGKVSLDIGFPVMLKAASGGGGKGIRIVRREQTFNDAFQAVRREAYASFADSRIFVEKYFDSPRHIEVQIFADQQGHVIHLYERECSIQRRYQKVVEECPSPCMDEELRSRMTAAAIQAAKSVNYTGAGTVEFLVDKERNFYFLEMNTRIQVEHSITEMVTGIDLVKEQIFIAAGRPLSIRQEDIACNGSAIECRIYAEDPKNSYLPAPGPVKKITMPQGPGIRVDCGVFTGWDVSRYYDPLIAKIAAWGRSRYEARRRMLRALDECMIFGVKTNLGLHKQILNDDNFKAGEISTGFIEDRVNPCRDEEIDDHDLAIITALCARLHRPTGKCEKTVQSGHDHSDLWRMASKYQFWATRF